MVNNKLRNSLLEVGAILILLLREGGVPVGGGGRCMRKSVMISIVYPPTTPAFSHPSFPEGGEWRYHRLAKLPPNLKKNPLRYGSSLDG